MKVKVSSGESGGCVLTLKNEEVTRGVVSPTSRLHGSVSLSSYSTPL